MTVLTKPARRLKRRRRVRAKISGTAERPRISVFRSNRGINAQLIDDVQGVTVASASTAEKSFSGATGTVDAAKKIGKLLGERAKDAGVESVVFDRGGNRYHGRVAGIADGAREAGLTL